MKLPTWRRRRREEELEDEIQSHLRMAIRDRMARGESADEAELAARREFGNVGLVKETTRGMWGFGWLETFWQDMRYGARMLLKQPGFTLMAILTLSLGIGANTAIFSAVNALLLSSPLAAQPEQMAQLDKLEGGFGNHTSFPNYRDLVQGTEAFSALAAFDSGPVNLGQGDAMRRVFGESVTGNYFPAFGVSAALGRTFGTEVDGALGASPVAVVSHGAWRRRFGADPGLVGKTIALNGHQFTVVGIMPEGFRGAWPLGIAPEIWTPLTMRQQLKPGEDLFGDRGNHRLVVIGRLKPGVTQAQAQAEVSLVTRRLAESYPKENRGHENAKVYPIDKLNDVPMRVIPVFMGLVTVIAGLVLLLACANVANLLLSRAMQRRQEVAIRLALGAGRRRLIRQLLTESLLLALAGGAAGCLLAVCVTSLLRLFPPAVPVPMEFNAAVDFRVMLFTLAVSLLSGALFGLAPAWQASKLDLVPMLKDDRRGAGGRAPRFSLRNLLVIAQVAVSLVFLICAGLFTRSLQQANNIDPGFEAERALTVSLDLESVGYDETRGRLFYRQLLEQIERMPGVQSATLAKFVLAQGEGAGSSDVAVEGYDAPGADYPSFRLNMVGPRYFETMGIPLLAGREFNGQDSEGAMPVVIVNETMARRFWQAPQSALGRRMRLMGRGNVLGPYYEVVGVAKDSKYRSLGEEPQSFFYVSALQEYRQRMVAHARTAGDPSLLRSAVRDRVLALDKGLMVEVATMRENLAASFLPARVAAIVLGLVGLFGLSLAAVGIYGVISYAVSRRTGEIGLRMAMGAESRDILRLVIGQGLKLTLIGVGVGATLALALSRLLSRLLIGVNAADPVTFLTVPLLLTAVAVFACWIPARRATKVDPMIALRFE
jgi:macrolide transport system ATP-binding/permease protein